MDGVFQVMEQEPDLTEVVCLFLRNMTVMNYEERSMIFWWLKSRMNPPYLVRMEAKDGPQATI